MKNILTGLAVGLIAATLLAQTGVSVRQLAGEPTLAASVLVTTPRGAGWARLGAGVSLVETAGGWEVRATQSRQRVAGERLAHQVDGSYSLAQNAVAETLCVYRNGIRQTVGEDYDFAAGVIRPLPAFPWEPSDLVVADYEY